MPEMEQGLFGTDGIRGVAGQFPLDRKTLELIGRSLVTHLTVALNYKPQLVIGRDTRESGPEIELAVARGALSAGAGVQSAGVITTPGVAYITRTTPFDAGIVISASHNPFRDNGIKIFSPSGKKLDDEMEQKIEADISKRIDSEIAVDDVQHNWLGDQAKKETAYRDRYISFLSNEIGRGLDLTGLKIGVDCANGAASEIAPKVFEELGADVKVISAKPDGRNINEACGSLHLEGLQKLVTDQALDLGIAFDGDADRALFVDASGSLVDGDATLFILAADFKRLDLLAGNRVVATVMSNIGLQIALRELDIELDRAQVGDRHVLEELLTTGAKLGGEQSGHIIFPDISLAGDGIITAIELLRAVRESRIPLGELASRMPRYPQILVNVRVRSKPPFETLPAVRAAADRIERELEGRGRLLLRYSGTENLARVMIEGQEEKKIKEQANELAEMIRQSIG